MKKNKNVSINEPMKDDVKGAANQILFLSLSKIWTSINWEIRNAVPDPIAIRIDINSEKFVEKSKVKDTPKINPK